MTRVRTLIQLSACFSGAISGCGNARWLRSSNSLDVGVCRSVSMLAKELSRALRMSTGENREKTSSVESGSSQY